MERLFENFENVLTPKECKVSGTVPKWLKGTMVRNGPGMFTVGDTTYNHWFDGPAYIQRYHFKDGKMWYSARFLESSYTKNILAAQRIIYSSFGTFRFPDPCKTIFQRLFSTFEDERDNCNVAFSTIGDSVYALTETTKMIRINLDTLENEERVDVGKYLTLHTYTAHHHCDPQGDIYNVGSYFSKNSHYVFAKTTNPLNIDGASSHSIEGTSLIAKVPATDASSPSYYHSFGMSENYLILFESPVRINVKKLAIKNWMHYTFKDCFFWDDSLDVNVLIVDKRTGKKIDLKVTSDPFFSFHHANSFEKDGCLVLDYCKMRNPGTFDDLLLEQMRTAAYTMNKDFEPYIHRMIIPLSIPSGAKVGDNLLTSTNFAKTCTAILRSDNSIHVQDMRLCSISLEFPRYNYEKYNMREYRYIYAVPLTGTTKTGVVKVDVINHTSSLWEMDRSDQRCGEPIFISNPDAKEEDEGIVIVPIMTTKEGDSPYVVILDAQKMKERGRYIVPEPRIPMGFHSHYVARDI